MTSEEVNRVGPDGGRYETVELRGHRCVQCRGDFSHSWWKIDRRWTKLTFAFYRLWVDQADDNIEPRFLHPKCLIALLKRCPHSRYRLCLSDTETVESMDYCNRFGRKLYAKNYVPDLPAVLAKHQQTKCQARFLKMVAPLFTMEQDFPRFYYRFKGDVKEFKRLRKKCNKRYAKYQVSVSLTPSGVTKLMSS